jgi:hypothetical protein
MQRKTFWVFIKYVLTKLCKDYRLVNLRLRFSKEKERLTSHMYGQNILYLLSGGLTHSPRKIVVIL